MTRSIAFVLVLALALPAAALAQQPPTSGQSGSSGGAGQEGVQVQAKSLIGSAVRGNDGKDIGKVSDVLIDPKDGRVSSVIVAMGGAMGVGTKDVTVPWQDLQVARDGSRLVVTLRNEVIPSAPSASPSSKQPKR